MSEVQDLDPSVSDNLSVLPPPGGAARQPKQGPGRARLSWLALLLIGVALLMTCAALEIIVRVMSVKPPGTGIICAPLPGTTLPTLDKPAGGFRVVVLGNPEVEGADIPTDQRAFRALAIRYQTTWVSPYEIIETCPAAASPADMYEAYQQSRLFHPDLVVAVLTPDSIETLHPDLSNEARYYTFQGNALAVVSRSQWAAPPGTRRGLFQFAEGPSALARGLDRALVQHRDEIPQAGRYEAYYDDPRYVQAWPIYEALMAGLRDAAQADGAAFAVMIAPDAYAIYPEWYYQQHPEMQAHHDLFDATKLERHMEQSLDRWSIPYISLTPFLQATAGTYPVINENGQWTVDGSLTAIEALDSWFRRMGWIPAGG